MTVSNTTSRNQYTATSGQTVFPYTFKIFDKDDIVVIQEGVTLTEGTDYTVSGVGVDGGGNVTLTTGATSGEIVTIYLDMSLTRTTDYQTSGDFLAADVNNDFDRLWLAAQQNSEDLRRSLSFPVDDLTFVSSELPSAELRANKYLTFGSTGVVTVTESINSSTTVQSGSFVPSYLPSTGSFDTINYTSFTKGKYVRIGSLVYISMRIALSGTTVLGSASGTLFIAGLPFDAEPSSAGYDMAPVALVNGWTSAPSALWVVDTVLGPLGYLYKSDSTPISVSDLDLTSSNQIFLSMCYRTSE